MNTQIFKVLDKYASNHSTFLTIDVLLFQFRYAPDHQVLVHV
jgi:hypothetical protein